MNTRGIRDTIKRRSIFNFYRSKATVICLQETHSEPEDEIIWASEWGGDILFSHGNRRSRGVCILLLKGMKKRCSNISTDNVGRYIKTDIEINNCVVSVCNIYAPNEDSPSFFEEINKTMAISTNNIIIIGDFNLVMNTAVDRIGSHNNKIKSKEVIEKMERDLLVDDIWRTQTRTLKDIRGTSADPH